MVRDRECPGEGQLLQGLRRKDERGEGRGGRGDGEEVRDRTDRLRRWGRTSLVGPWSRLHTPNAGVQVWSLAGVLRKIPHMPHGVAKKKKRW